MPQRVLRSSRLRTRSQAPLGNVVLQAGACFVGSQSGDWELANPQHIIQRLDSIYNLKVTSAPEGTAFIEVTYSFPSSAWECCSASWSLLCRFPIWRLGTSAALLGNVVVQAGACFVSSQSGDWELANPQHIIQRLLS